MSDAIVFRNHHRDPLPDWVGEQATGVRSYFENAHGEQWVAEAGRERFRLAGGDIGWRTIEVASPDYARLAKAVSERNTIEGIVLNVPESTWLVSVFLSQAGGAKSPRRLPAQ